MNHPNIKKHPELYRYICKLANCPIPNFSPKEWNTFTQLLDEAIAKVPPALPQLNTWSETLLEMRTNLGLTLRIAAQNSGISAATISRIENGKEADYSSIQSLWDFYLTYNHKHSSS